MATFRSGEFPSSGRCGTEDGRLICSVWGWNSFFDPCGVKRTGYP